MYGTLVSYGEMFTHMRAKGHHSAFAVIAVTLAIAACYFNSLHNPFVWDQEVVIAGNPMIRSWHYLPDVFQTNVEGRRLIGVGFYRPMEVISYMADYSLWKLDPFGYHCTSLFLHLCNSLLLLLLLRKIGLGRSAGFFASLVFAVHPVNSEAVTYSIRGDLLGARGRDNGTPRIEGVIGAQAIRPIPV